MASAGVHVGSRRPRRRGAYPTRGASRLAMPSRLAAESCLTRGSVMCDSETDTSGAGVPSDAYLCAGSLRAGLHRGAAAALASAARAPAPSASLRATSACSKPPAGGGHNGHRVSGSWQEEPSSAFVRQSMPPHVVMRRVLRAARARRFSWCLEPVVAQKAAQLTVPTFNVLPDGTAWVCPSAWA